MPDLNLLAILVAGVAAFIISSTWYTVFAAQLAGVRRSSAPDERPAPWKIGVEFLRGLVLAAIVAGLASQGGVTSWPGGLLLGLALWAGFPLVLWVGAMTWEGTSPRLAAIHAGDWLVKLLALATILSVWH